jgi:hypothetical protein
MALSMKDLRKLLDAIGLKYFLHPDRPAILMGANCHNGVYQIVISLQDDGRFLQMRTLSYLRCPEGHPHLNAVLRTLTAINFRHRFAKFTWDPGDGEILAYGDAWIVDGKLTKDQLHRIIGNLVPAIDLAQPRIVQTIETGKDPGEQAEGKAGGPAFGKTI